MSEKLGNADVKTPDSKNLDKTIAEVYQAYGPNLISFFEAVHAHCNKADGEGASTTPPDDHLRYFRLR